MASGPTAYRRRHRATACRRNRQSRCHVTASLKESLRTKETNHYDQHDPPAQPQRAVRADLLPEGLGLPTAGVLVVACLDHRVDPAIVLGLELGEAPVIRNVEGRVTQAVIDDVAFLAFLVEQLSGGPGTLGTLFEVAVIHHTQCGTALLADEHSGTELPRPLGCPRPHSKLPSSPTLTSRSTPTSSDCSTHRHSRRESVSPATSTTSPLGGSVRLLRRVPGVLLID